MFNFFNKLEQKWEKKRKKIAFQTESNIKTKGRELLDKKEALHKQYLVFNRQGKDTQYIEGQLNILNLILGDGKDEEKS